MLNAVVRAFVLLALGVAAALSLAFRLGNEHTWWIELLRYVPYPAWLAPMAAVLLASLRLSWRWRAMAVLALALQVFVAMHPAVGRAEPGTQPLRVMTYNIKSYVAEERGRGYRPIVAEIRRHDPDLLVLQDAQQVNENLSGVPPVMAEFMAGLHSFRHGQYIVLSRHPLRGCAVHPMTVGHELADFVTCVVATPAGELDLATVHFVSPRDGLNATRHERLGGLAEWRANVAERLAQARRLADWIAARRPAQRPLIVAGDLNAPEHSPVVRLLLAQGLRDAHSSAGWGWGHTHGHSLRPHISFLRIDHILVNERLAVQRSEVGDKLASEHRPVIADLWLVPAR